MLHPLLGGEGRGEVEPSLPNLTSAFAPQPTNPHQLTKPFVNRLKSDLLHAAKKSPSQNLPLAITHRNATTLTSQTDENLAPTFPPRAAGHRHRLNPLRRESRTPLPRTLPHHLVATML